MSYTYYHCYRCNYHTNRYNGGICPRCRRPWDHIGELENENESEG